jgi:hypothetical protein
MTYTSVLWGFGGKGADDGAGRTSLQVLPFGLLIHQTKSPGQSSFHVLGTGVSHKEAADHSGTTSRFRLLGIPLWSSHRHG